MLSLKANTAVDVLIGPFVDSSDGNTVEDGLTISQADVRLSKNGQNMAQKNDATACTHDELGYYNCELDATDLNTEGSLVLVVHESGSLPVRHEYDVLAEAAWDSLFAAKDTGYMDINVKAVSEDTTAADNLESACDNYSVTRGLSGTALPAAAADAAGGLPISDAGGLDLDDIPITSEFEARTIVSADYEVVGDTIAGVTLVDTVTTNTDTAAELAKVPKSDGTSSWNDTALAAIQSEANDALVAYAPPTKAEMDTGHGLLATEAKQDTINGIVDDILVDTAGLNGDAMRGTNSAALASVCTEGRLSELDAGNLPTDIAAIPTAAEIKTAMEADNSDLDYLVTHLVNKTKIAIIDGNTEQFNDSNELIGTIATAYRDDGTDVFRLRMAQVK